MSAIFIKKSIAFILLIVYSTIIFGQEEKEEVKKPIVKFSGYIGYEAYFDTYESITSRDGDVYLFPVRQVLNSKNEDIKAYNKFNMLSAQSRIGAKMDGPKAFGAKVSGLIEIDFLGKAAISKNGESIDLIQTPRIRHMYFSLDWDKTQLTFGQTWHPLFVTECFPEVLGMGAAIPFNPLNRSPQIRLSYKLSDKVQFVGAALSYLDYVSSGPVEAQNNAVLPDLHGQLKYRNGILIAGLTAGYKVLKPRTYIATDSSITNKTIGSYDLAAFATLKSNSLTLKFYGVYGQNMTSYVMIGGFGAANDPTTVADYSYSNINTMALWSEVMYKIHVIELGLFAGYSANLSNSTKNFYSLAGYTRAADIHNLVRISPRITYTWGNVILGLEYMLTKATYFNLASDKYLATKTDESVANNRFYFMARYSF